MRFYNQREITFLTPPVQKWFHILRDRRAISSDLSDTATNNQDGK